MSITVGTSPDVLSYLQSLLQPASSGSAGASDPLTSLLSELDGSSTNNQTGTASAPAGGQAAIFSPPLGAGTMSALFSLQGQSANGAPSPSQWFSKLDTDGDGQISQSEFEAGLASKGVSTQTADALFAKLDANGDGTLSQSELAKARHHHHHGGDGAAQANGSSGQNAINDLLSSVGADGATTQTVTNSDGTTTTTISYSDGSTISMTSAATPSSGGTSNAGTDNGTGSTSGTNNASNSNLLEKLFQLQAQLLSTAVSTLSTLA